MKITARKVFFALLALFLGIVVFRIVSNVRKKVGKNEAEEQVFIIRTDKVARKDFFDRLKISGTIRPFNEIDIFPKIAGRIIELNFNVGDLVKTSDVLAVIEHKELSLQEKSALAALAIAKASEQSAHNDLERAKKLFAENALAKNQLEQLELKYELAKAQGLSADAQAKLASQQLSNATITSLISGAITRRPVNVGSQVAPQTLLFSVQDSAKLKLVTSVDAETLRRLKKGMEASFMSNSIPKKEYKGTLASLSPSLDAHSKRAAIELEIENADQDLIPNSFVDGFLVLNKEQSVLVISNRAINYAGEKPSIYKVVDAKIQIVFPELGPHDQEYTVVKSGLVEGDVVAISGLTDLSEGQAVTIE
jgi:membrane fusion protein (multidrug efflux system)